MWGQHVVLASTEQKLMPARIVSCDSDWVGMDNDARAKCPAQQVEGGSNVP